MLGKKAPDFALKNQHGQVIALRDFTGQRVVIYFYPKDNTPGCTVQACNLRDNYEAITQAGIKLIGVSADSEQSHRKFTDKFSLPFDLLADSDHQMMNDYGVWGEKKFMGKVYDGIHRTTFILDEAHTIKGIIEKPNTKDHATEVLAFYS